MEQMIYLGLGSNVGDRKGVLRKCLELLEKYDFHLGRISSLYETPPWGKTDQPGFLNQVVGGTYAGTPQDLLVAAMRIEHELGRVRQEHWGPRTLDIDILAMGRTILHSQRLTVPHPYLHQRGFVLVPFAEIAPHFVVPGLDCTITEFLAALPAAETEHIRRLEKT